MKWLQKFATNDKEKNASYCFRKKRINIFNEYLNKLDRDKVTILDIGGSSKFWEYWENLLDLKSRVFIINLDKNSIDNSKGIVGNAINLKFIKEKKIDIVFSNSLIEHLFCMKNQIEFAKSARKIGKYYFIQTPSFVFPLEPHFLFPFFHWLPKRVRIFLHSNLDLGWYKAESDIIKAKKQVDEIRILQKRELKKMFPDCRIIVEKYFGIPKSYIATNMRN